MDGQFHEVLRDFALEKMKEIESKESTRTERRKAIIRKARNATYSDSSDDAYLADRVMDSIKAIPATKEDKDETDQVEKHSKKRHHHKHSKRETHHHKSRRKDKKHSSSSKHKRKHKRKSSSHSSSKDHKKKDRRKVESNRVLEKVERAEEDSNNKSESTKDEAKNEDSDLSTAADTVDEDSDFEVGSVSPPNRLEKEHLSEKDPSHNSNERSNGSPRNADPIVKKDESSLKYDKAEDKLSTLEKQQRDDDTVEKKDNQTLLHKSCDPILHPSHRENHQKPEQCHTSSKMVKDEVPDNKFQSADRGGLKVRESDEKLKLLDKGLSKTSESLTKEDGESLMIGLLGNQRATSDLQTKVGCIREETSVSLSPPSKEDFNIKAENESQESYLELDNIKKDKDTLQKLQNKQKMIKINIKTLELPTDALLTTEDKAKDEENGDSNTSEEEEEEEDNNGSDAASPGRLPWRIIPEEGELSPSTASDGGEQSKVETTTSKVTEEKVETTSKITDEKVETTSKETDKSKEEIKDKDGRHKHSKKRRQEGREDGEITAKRKKQRHQDGKQDKRSESSFKGYTVRSVKDRLGVRQKSNSPDRKAVRSSVVVRDKKSPRRYPGHSRSRSKSPAQRRSHSRSPHSSRNSSRRGRSDRSRSRSPGYGQRANSPHGRRNNSYRDKGTNSRDRKRDRSRSGSRERSRRRRRERSYTPVEEIDKKKLFEFAKANAYLYQKVLSGDLPATTKFPQVQLKSKVVSLSGGKTVDELTEVCKSLSKVDGEDSSDEEPLQVPVTSDDERDSFIRHPFLVKERPTSIVLNIQNAIPIPVQNSKEKLRVQFPVSSGTQHRKKEESTTTGPFGEWEPVKKPKPASATPGPSNKSPVPPVVPPPGGTSPSTSSSAVSLPVATPSLPAPSLPAVPAPSLPPVPVPVEDRVFDETPADNVNIADVVAMRLKAARQLQSNPLDIEALSSMHRAQHRLQNWVNKESKPGLFTGRTDANILTPLQLANPNRKNQAWAKKDMFHHHMPVQGGIGMQLLQKMGWKQGEGLGRNKEGVTLPIMLDVKMDRKGLAVKPPPKMTKMLGGGRQQKMRNQTPNPPQASLDLSGKHPVSVLNELCSKRRWPQADYVTVHEEGPPHRKEFIFKVILNGEEFQGSVSCNNKKEAKALAAETALIKMGLLPNPSQAT